MGIERDNLLSSLYEQLRRHAQRAIRQERPDHTLTPTALVHEAYLRLGGSFENKAHFYAAAAESMRRVLVDHARARLAEKRGGPDRAAAKRGGPDRAAAKRVEAAEVADLASICDPAEILALDEALSRLESRDPEAAAVVRLRYFAGLEIEETAASLRVSSSSVKRDWQFAKAFLYREMSR